MTITTLTAVAPSAVTAVAVPEPSVSALAPVITLDDRRRSTEETPEAGEAAEATEWRLGEAGAASAEYAAVTACGVGLAGVLLKLLTSDFGQNLLQTLIEFFLKMVGIG